MRLLRCLCLLLAGLLALSGVAPAHAQDSWQPTAEEQWLFELRTSRFRVGDGIRGYSDGDRVCVALSDIVLALDLPLRVDGQLRRATGWAFDESHTLEIDRDARRVTIGSRSEALGAGDILDVAEGWCVDPAVLGEWLGVALHVNLSDAVLRLESAQPLPFELAAQRRARAGAIQPASGFSLADMPRADRPYRLWQTPSVDIAASAAVMHDASSGQTRRQTRYEIFASGEVLGLSADARLSSDDGGVPESLRLRVYRSDPDGRLLGPMRATHVAIGDVATAASPIAVQPAMGRGAVATNRPLDLPDSFDRTSFRGDLPAGWEAELYRNGQLLAFASPGPDGRYEFLDVRLHFGLNRFEIVLYGPQGQVRRELRAIPVGMDAIPPGKLHYSLGIAQEGRDLLRLTPDRAFWRRGWRGLLTLEYGVDRRTSLGAWASSLVIDDRRYDVGEAALRRTLGPTIAEFAASAQSGGGRAGRLLWSGQFGRSYFQAESIIARGGYRSDRIHAGVTGLHSLSLDLFPRLGGAMLPLHLEARWRERADGQDRIETAGRLSANWRNITMTGQLDWAHSRSVRGGRDELVASLLANARLGRLRLRGEAAVGLSGAPDRHRVALVGEWSQSERTDWRAELGYEAGARRVRAGVGYTRRFDRVALTGFAEVASDGSVAGGAALSLALGPDPLGGRVRLSRDPLASQGQALAMVFHDENGDGLRQDGEPLASGVVLTAGNALAERATDVSGRTIVDSLAPFRPVLIGVDESSLADPLVRVAVPGVVIVPRPGVAIPVMLPLVSAGEVEGVLRRAGGSGMEGVDLELVDGRGAVRATTRSDYDGFFLFESVPYGRYTLRVAAPAALMLGMEAGLGDAVLERDSPRARLGVITIQGRTTLAQTRNGQADDM